eukprot:3000129-Karenia_brevis.AAC.1
MSRSASWCVWRSTQGAQSMLLHHRQIHLSSAIDPNPQSLQVTRILGPIAAMLPVLREVGV